jgi:hypothetical protein
MTLHEEFPDFDQETLKTACDSLGDPGASWEYPGFVLITKGDIEYSFGTANGCYGYDTTHYDLLTDDTLPFGATPAQLETWIRKMVTTHKA